MHEKDLRMRTLEEMMRGIKTIKYNSYEHYFDERVKTINFILLMLICVLTKLIFVGIPRLKRKELEKSSNYIDKILLRF